MVDLLADNPLLVLFVVTAIGYPLGRLRVGGFRLGVAAVLFSGLLIGAVDARLALPSELQLFGLTLFIYTIGLASGPGFVASLKRQGVRDNLLVLGLLLFASLLTAALHYALGLNSSVSAGLFAGSLTNTPALASVLERLPRDLQAAPVVAYALSYPIGVIGVIVLMQFMSRWVKADFGAEAKALRDLGASGEHLVNTTVQVTRPDIGEISIAGWREREGWEVIFGRFRRGGSTQLVYPYTVLHPGDAVSVIGSEAAVARAVAFLGEPSAHHLEFDRSELDFRRVFVSNPEVADKTLAELKLPQRYGALITRVRRGDSEMLPHGQTRLELGDRVRVLTRREVMPQVTKLFGDSYRALSEVNMLPLSLGIIMGLLLGTVPIPLPGGLSFSLGMAGGPLVVAIILGAIGRSGKLVWQLPYSANLTLRQLGLILFLAGVGTRSGYAFGHTVASAQGLRLIVCGGLITLTTALLTLLVGYKLYHIPMSLLLGLLAGLQTQPAALAFASERTGNDLPTIGYATVFPLATILKILLAQLLVLLLP